MREIEFRGKRMDNGKWVYGNLIKMDSSGNQTFIFPFYEGTSTLSCSQLVAGNMVAVDPATVGQYTGLRDKNGVEIYEEDIIYSHHVEDEKAGPVVFSDIHHGYIIDYPRENGREQWQPLHGKEHCYEVIGHIHHVQCG